MSENSNAFIYGNYLTGGSSSFPIDCETFDNIQNNQALLAVLAQIAGDDKLIISGCKLTGNTVGFGYVYMKTGMFPQGEILYVPGGFNASDSTIVHIKSVGTEVKIGTTTSYANAYTTRTLIEGYGENNCNWREFKSIQTNAALDARCKILEQKVVDLKPLDYGIPLMWAGPIINIPEEYKLCDGQDKFKIPTATDNEYEDLYNAIGTIHTLPEDVANGFFRLPNLSGRFIAGYQQLDGGDYNFIGKTGGVDKTTKILNHTHSYMGDDSIGQSTMDTIPFMHEQYKNHALFGDLKERGGSYTQDMMSGPIRLPNGTYHEGTLGFYATSAPMTMKYTGPGNQMEITRGSFQQWDELDNRPPYFTLAYIMRVRAPKIPSSI